MPFAVRGWLESSSIRGFLLWGEDEDDDLDDPDEDEDEEAESDA